MRSAIERALGSRAIGAVILGLATAAALWRYPSLQVGLALFILYAASLPSRDAKQIGLLIAGSASLLGLIWLLITRPERIAWSDLQLNAFFWGIISCFWLVLIFSLSPKWSGRLTWLSGLLIAAELTFVTGHDLIAPVTRGKVRELAQAAALLSMGACSLASIYAGLYVFLKLREQAAGWLLGGAAFGIAALPRLIGEPPGIGRLRADPLLFIDFPFKLLSLIAAGMLPAMLLHLLLITPDPRDRVERWRIVYYLIYVPPLWAVAHMLSSLYAGSAVGYPKLGLILLPAYAALSIGVAALWMAEARQYRVRREMRFILIVLVAVSLIVGLGGLWGVRAIGERWGFNLFSAAFALIPLSLGYATLKRRALNLSAAVRWAVVHALLFILMAAFWIVFYYGIFRLLFPLPHRREAMGFLMALVFGVVMPFAKSQVKEFVDKTFYRESYDYARTLTQFTRALTSIIDYDRLVELLVSRVCVLMRISRGALLLNSPDHPETLKVASIRGVTGMEDLEFNAEGKFASELMRRGEPMPVEEMERLYKLGRIDEEEMGKLVRFDAELCVPIFSKGRLIGMLLLGPKLSGEAYTHEDAALLSALADQAAITIENIRLYAERAEQERIRRELENARRIQMGILPDEDPQTEAIEVSSFFRPAAEVGGDYYDYVRFPGMKFGIAIGDVSGHGLDAGLLVSMAKSCLFTTTRRTDDIEEVMRAMNEMVCQVKGRLFMTFAFSVIDAENHIFSISSAGHPFPYHYSAATGELRAIEDGSYPLGVRTDQEFKVHTFRLVPGDLLIFFSDGIIEAENERGELLGFERFERIIKSSVGGGAREVRDRILSAFDSFRGNAPLVDDVTLIVVRYI